MIITENKRSYCTAEHMKIATVSTDALDTLARFTIENCYRVPLSSWVFVTMNRETLCVNKAHPHAEQLADLARQFMQHSPEDEESVKAYREIESLAGTNAVNALCGIYLDWIKERRTYLNHLEALEFVEKARTALHDDFPINIDTGLLKQIRHLGKDEDEELALIFLWGYLYTNKENERKEVIE